MARLTKRLLSLTSALALCVGMASGTMTSGMALSGSATSTALFSLADTANWDNPNVDIVYSDAQGLELKNTDRNTAENGGSSFTAHYTGLENDPRPLNVRENPWLHFDATAHNGWRVILFVKNASGQMLDLDLNKMFSYSNGEDYAVGDMRNWGSHAPYNGNMVINRYFSMEQLIEQEAAGAGREFVIPDDGIIYLYKVKIFADWVDKGKGLTIRDLSLAPAPEGREGVLDVTTADNWETTGGDMKAAITEQDSGLYIKVTEAPMGSSWTQLQSNGIATLANPVRLNVAGDAMLDLDMTADNGFNITMFVRNPETRKAIQLDLNKYLTKIGGGAYEFGTYGDKAEGSRLTVDRKISLSDMLAKANEAAAEDARVTIPANGMMELYEIRVFINYVPVGEGLEIRRLALRETRADKDILSASIDGVQGVIDQNAHTVSFTLPAGSGVTALEPVYTVSEGAVVLESGAKDFTNPQTYTVKAENGSTQTYTVSVQLADRGDNTIFAAKIGEVNGVIDQSAHTIAFTLTAGTDITALTPVFTISEGASILESGAKDFTNPQTYTVQAENGDKQTYTVSVTVEARTEKKILTAKIGDIHGVIDQSAHTIAFTLPAGSDVTALEPVFTVSEGASILESGAKDFTNPQTYTVKAEDGGTQTYVVSVKVLSRPADFYQVNLETVPFAQTQGDGKLNFSEIIWNEEKKALVLQAGNPGDWANVDGEIDPVSLNLNKATHLHFDLTAGNGWNLVLFFKDEAGKLIQADVNRFIASRDQIGSELYYTGSYKDSLSIKELIVFSNPDYVLPADGILSLTGVRFWVGYHGEKDASIEVRYVALDDADASNTVKEEGGVQQDEVRDHYTADLKDGWKPTGEGDIGIGSVKWDEEKKVLAVIPDKAGVWTNVDYTFEYGEKILLDINKAKYLHYELTAGNGWNVVVVLKDDKGNTIALEANDFVSKSFKGMEGISYTGSYKEALPLAEMIAYAKEKAPDNAFEVPADGIVELVGLRLWVGYHGDKDASIHVKTLALDDQTASHTEGYKADVYSTAPKKAWTPINSHWVALNNGDIGIGFVGYDASKGGLSIVPNKAGNWTQIDYNFAYGEIVKLNLNEASHLHFDITAGNGWDFQILLVDENGETLPISANRYMSEKKGMQYDVRLYKGDYKEKLDIKAMIQSALNADQSSKFKLPANGIVQIKELRIWVGFHSEKDDASMVVRRLTFNNEAGTNTDDAPNTGGSHRAAVACGVLLVCSAGTLVLARKKRKGAR